MIIQGKIPGAHTPINVVIEGKKVFSVEPAGEGAYYDFGGPDLYLCRGFFDPQVNGFAGIDFNGKGLTSEGLHRAALSIASSGITHFLPTVITASHERIVRQMKIITVALENDSLVKRMCPGIHLEGPFISPEDWFIGSHPREFIRPPQWYEVERLQDVCRGHIRYITLAPKIGGAIPFTEKATIKGIVVGLGHTNASEAVF